MCLLNTVVHAFANRSYLCCNNDECCGHGLTAKNKKGRVKRWKVLLRRNEERNILFSAFYRCPSVMSEHIINCAVLVHDAFEI